MKKLVVFVVALVLTLSMMFTFCACGDNTQKENGETNETEYVEQEKKIYLESLALDDESYAFSFEPSKTEYTVNLPAGRPPIPRVSATASEGMTVDITQAYIADNSTKGTAYIVISDGELETTYTVDFVRDISNGFVLQFDDRFVFPETENKKYTYKSSDENVISVDENGLMIAKKVSDSPVTVTASANGKVEKTLIVDRVEKAHINLFFITGQSNGQGCFDNIKMNGMQIDESSKERYYGYMDVVEKIGQDGCVYSFDVHPRNENIAYLRDKGLIGATEGLANRFCDLNQLTRQGHASALGKEWYNTTGEKVVFLQSAWSGSPIESWLDMRKYDFAGKYSSRNFWATTKDGYKILTAMISNNYEIIRSGNFWCQGETAMTSYYSKIKGDYIKSSDPAFNKSNMMTAETYSQYFQYLHNDMVKEYGIEFSAIMMVRNRTSTNRAMISTLVSAFFELVNNKDNTIYLGTRKFTEIARTASGAKDEGYGLIDVSDLHYSQKGYNYHGKEAAINVLGAIYGGPNNKATGVEIIDTNGLTRLENNYSMQLKVGKTHQIATLPTPWTSGENVTLVSDNPSVATVDQFGLITAVSAGSAKITATSESGASISFFVIAS